MNRSLPISLAVLQALALHGADFTSDELRREIDKIRLLELDLPADLPPYPRLSVNVISCRKCGKGMLLGEEPGLMRVLTNRLNEKCGEWYRFTLDESSLCPYCGDGRFYLDIQAEVLDFPTLKIDKETLRRIPVDRADLLFLLSGWERGRTLRDGERLTHRLRSIFENGTFSVMSEDEFRALSVSRHALKTGQPTDMDKQKKEAAERKRLAEKKEAAEMFQKFASSAHVMRREDLDAYLEKSASLSRRHYDYRPSHFMLLTRMLILRSLVPGAWTPLTCPACTRRYYVCNGTNVPVMQPLGDLLEAMKKIDISPDFSSLCPYCHPDAQNRKLAVTIHAEGQKDQAAELTPGDLVLLSDFVAFHDRYPFSMPEVMRMRLKEILLGEKGNARISARPLSAKEK